MATSVRAPRRARRARQALTRERILAESAGAFNRRGYGATTLGDIAGALGVTPAALYYHVRNKEDLLFQCHRRALDMALEAVRAAVARTDAADGQLRLVIRHYIEGVTDQLAGAVVLIDDRALSPERRRYILPQREEYEGMLAAIITRGVAQGIFVPCNPRLVVFALLGALNWIPCWYHPGRPWSAQEIGAAFTEYFVRGLLKRPPAVPLPPAGLDDESRPAAEEE